MKLIFLAACLLCTSAPQAQDTLRPEWIVCFTFKHDNPLEPTSSLRIVVRASSEGDAAIKAHKYLSEKLTGSAAEQLQFLEAQMRK